MCEMTAVESNLRVLRMGLTGLLAGAPYEREDITSLIAVVDLLLLLDGTDELEDTDPSLWPH